MAKMKASSVVKDEGSGKGTLDSSKKTLDPALASLFASSLGPVVAPSKSRRNAKTEIKDPRTETSSGEDDARSNDHKGLPKTNGAAKLANDKSNESLETDPQVLNLEEDPIRDRVDGGSQRKRKRKHTVEEIEDVYMRRLANEEAKEQAKRASERPRKRHKEAAEERNHVDDNDTSSDGEHSTTEVQEDINGEDSSEAGSDVSVPMHESLRPSKDAAELDKASRTVFLANVSTTAITSKSARKTLLAHLSSFLNTLPTHSPPHKVESLRFRSTAFASAIPKKAAFAKKDVMDATTKSTNAYAVYSTQLAAREAAKRLNATMVLDRHLRADLVAHPAATDHRRCVFVGNLGFVDDESNINASEDGHGNRKPNKKKEPGDVEEGLWRQFGKAGTVESVRVVRDPKTRVGKGFAYVQFTDQNGVEAALLFDGKKFPPLLPRKLRVVRAKGVKRNAARKTLAGPGLKDARSEKGVYRRKVTGVELSLQGRARKMLGRAAAAQIGTGGRNNAATREGDKANNKVRSFRAPESFVFEGHRASSKQGKSGLKLGRPAKKSSGKPKAKVRKRSAAWRAAGGKKPK